MIEKHSKVRNLDVISSYIQVFNYCEACLWLKGKYNPCRLSVHHVLWSSERTDEWWNLLTVCHECHEKATHHHLVHGSHAREVQVLFLAIKWIKKEISEEILVQKNKHEEAIEQAKVIENSICHKRFLWAV